MNSMKDCYELANGVKIPCMGYGTYKAAEGNNESIIKPRLKQDTGILIQHLSMIQKKRLEERFMSRGFQEKNSS